MRLTWGNQKRAIEPIRERLGLFREITSLFAGLVMWLLTMAVFSGALVLTGAVTLLLVLVWLPCFLRSKVLPKDKA